MEEGVENFIKQSEFACYLSLRLSNYCSTAATTTSSPAEFPPSFQASSPQPCGSEWARQRASAAAGDGGEGIVDPYSSDPTDGPVG